MQFHIEEEDQEQVGHVWCSAEGYKIKYSTKNCPRPAEDDVIQFEGIRAKLFVPAGEGRRVYEAILAAKDELAA